MSEYQFHVGTGRVSEAERKRCNRAAQEYGFAFEAYQNERNEWCYFFRGPNYGEPYDSRTGRAIIAKIGKVRLWGEPSEATAAKRAYRAQVRASGQRAARHGLVGGAS